MKKPRPKWKVWAIRLFLLAAAGVGAAVLGIGLLFFWVAHDSSVPDVTKLGDYKPKLVTRIYGTNNAQIGELAQERRTVIPFDKIPLLLRQAVVDAEDSNFYEHGGVSYLGMLRAAWSNVRHAGIAQGGSTITQQTVKNILLKPERTFKRKIQEIYLAYRLEHSLSKDEILGLYINHNNYGHGRYGCEEAARFYFGRGCSEIDLGQAALLAGLPQSPARLDPLKHPEAAKRRQVYVLEQMVRHGHAKEEDAKKIEGQPIRIVKSAESKGVIAPEVIDLVKQQLGEKFGEDKLWSLGTEVHTTIDPKIQEIARRSLEKGLEEIDAREGFSKPLAHLDGKKLAAHLKQLGKDVGDAPKTGSVYEGVVT